MHFAPLTSDMRRELGIGRDVGGVVITGIDSGSVADDLGLSRGDIVQAINQQPVKSPEDAAQKLESVEELAAQGRAPTAQPPWRDPICWDQRLQGA